MTEENNKNNPQDNQQNTNDLNPEHENNFQDDFEMGSDEEDTSEEPRINKYTDDIKSPANPQQPSTQSSVDPTAAPPTQSQSTQDIQSQQHQSQQSPNQNSAANQAPPPPNWMQKKAAQASQEIKSRARNSQGGKKRVSNPAAKKKAILGCLGTFLAVVVIFLILSFIFIAQSGPTQQLSPIAELLGIQQASFINGLINFIHLIFILVSLLFFTLTMVGLFRASMAKKEDKISRKNNLKLSLISGSILISIFIIWLFVFVYLDGKRIRTGEEVILDQAIVTEPADTLLLTAPISIRFDASNAKINSAQFRVLQYQWDFGDGETATGQVVTHTYEEKGSGDGIFNVILTITRQDRETGEEFVDTYSTIVSIENQALSAIIEADPLEGSPPLTVEFDASQSIDPDGEIESFEWDLDGDGDYDDETGPTATYTFEDAGRYMVGLQVTSTTGDIQTAEKEIVVSEGELPTAVIEVTGDPESYLIDTQYIFSADESTSPNGTIEEYEWDFGDGSPTADTKTASHAFDTAGTYEVTLTVTDEEGEVGETSLQITVGQVQGTPNAVINSDPEISGLSLRGTVPFSVVFDASQSTDSDDNIVDYEWDFDGDGVTDGFGERVNHTFNSAGTYDVGLTAIDADDNEGEANMIVIVEAQGVVADVTADKTNGSAPLTVTFDASGSSFDLGSITSYEWDFGDGTSTKLGNARISHKYSSIGTYTATVKVIGSDASTDTAEIIITVREVPLAACFVSVFEEGPAPLQTSFDPGCSTGTVTSYFWEFGDGSTSTQRKPVHTFDEAGTYTVTLEVSDADNTVSTSTLEINVTE